ncbi:MAG TPA: S8 family peptidase [Aquabacterium sp.]|uniref:S8 family peptidase n=1 Tax=Aquabacterium sp. TaxID=1872578 RepID=UPI002E2F5301|nr:S8 family peptidase [Aquabacterium sp.]HEX5356663.1 S8 family peptidase [Aquabacterium sp.]
MGLMSLAHAADTEVARVIVKLKPDATVLRTTLAQAQAVADGASSSHPMARLGARRGLTVADGRALGNQMHVATAQGLSSQALAASLSKDSDVLYAVPDRLRKPMSFSGAPTDPLFAASGGNPYVLEGQWYLRQNNVTFKSATNAASAWSSATGNGVTVAVLDSGVRFDHPDLTTKLESGYNMISYASVSQVNGGRSADASDLGDWVDATDVNNVNAELHGNTGCTEQASSSWHGTKVAGIIGAETNNGVGMASMAPDVRLVPVRVLGKCGGWDSDILAGMRWAAGLSVPNVPANSHPAKVLNMSLGAPDACPQTYKDVVAELTALNVVVVVSAGNDNGLAVSSPASCPGVIAVTGLRHTGTKVAFSSVGPEVSISAPGGNCVNVGVGQTCLYPILTTSNTGVTVPIADGAGGSTYSDSISHPSYGTSFSAPQVSGAVALMLEARPTLTPAAVRSLLMASARTFPTSGSSPGVAACHLPNGAVQDECYCTQLTCGAGMLDVNQAVQLALTNPVAVIARTPESAQPGQPIQFSGSQSMASPGASTIVSYHWTLLDGGGIVNSSGWAADSSPLVVLPTAEGMFEIRLTVVDDQGHAASSDQWIVVGQPGTSNTATANSSGGGGGGGSVSALDLLALASLWAMAALRTPRRAVKA